MSIKITNECINCGACEPECPNNAIYEGSSKWKFSDGTNLKGKIINNMGVFIDASLPQPSIENDIYFIVPDKCTECVDFYKEPQCAAVCPVDCCIPDENNIENYNSLLKKKKFLHS